jgi:heme-degrading monooxygenase HmoA
MECRMPTSAAGVSSPLVLINVFTVDPEKQQLLIELWQRATDDVIRHLPGFVSATIHRSLDGTKVVNYAQWESRDSHIAMFRNPEAQAYLGKLAELGTPAPTLCEVVSVHKP